MGRFTKKLLVLIALLSGCSQSATTEVAVVVPAISVSGFTYFKNVTIGFPVKAKVTLNNKTTSPAVLTIVGNAAFALTPDKPGCATEVAAATICVYNLGLIPVAKGQVETTLTFGGEVVIFKANVINAAIITSSISALNVGTLIAGTAYPFTVNFTNSGDLRSLFPTFSGSSMISVLTSNCGFYIEPGEVCTANLSFRSYVRNHTLSTSISFYAGGATGSITITGMILAAEMTGNIIFSSIPAALVVGGSYTVITSAASDEYGNEIEDGTTVIASFFNLNSTLNGNSSPITVSSVAGRFTVNFNSVAAGTAILSLNHTVASGVLNWVTQP